jgi:pyruvate/2-oxoglutarate dehydrogenase complex dihydrolipoamide acyltransferase (E2) component
MIDIIVPKIPGLASDASTAKIIKWLVPTGAQVIKSEPVLEIETDKATLEVAAPASGIIFEQIVPEGSVVPLGTIAGHLLQSPE